MHQRTRFHAFSLIPTLALSLLAQAPDPAPVPSQPAAAAYQNMFPSLPVAASPKGPTGATWRVRERAKLLRWGRARK